MSVTLTPAPELDIEAGVIEEARRRRNRRRGGILIALAAIALIAVGALLIGGSGGRSSQQGKPKPGRHAKPVAQRPPTVTARVPVGTATGLVASDGSVWVLEEGAVVRIGAARGRVQARIRVPDVGGTGEIAAGDGDIWIAPGYLHRGAVDRIDPSTDRVVAVIPIGGVAEGVAVGGGRVWVARLRPKGSELIQIDPASNRVVGSPIPLGGDGPGQVAYGDRRVWVQNTSPESVMRIDPQSGHVETILGAAPRALDWLGGSSLAVGDGSLWTVRSDVLTRWRPLTSEVIATISIPRASFVAVSPEEIWVLVDARARLPGSFEPIKHSAALWEVDPRSNRLVGKPLVLNGPITATVSGTNVWILNRDYPTEKTTLLRIAPVLSAHG